MRLAPALAAAAFCVAACGGASRTEVATPAPQPLPAPPQHDRDAAAPVASTACLAPWGKALGNAKVDPKPIEPAKLAEVDAMGGAPPEQAFARARVYFEAQHWVEAAERFREIALGHPDADVGMYAAQLYLSCLDVLAGMGGRRECYGDMIRDVPQLIELYCTSRRHAHQDECETLDRVQSDILRLQAESTVATADQSGDRSALHEGAEKYLALLRAECLPPRAGQGRCDEIAYNAAVAFMASGDTASAERVRAIMLDPNNGMAKSPLAAKLVCRLGGACP